MSFFILVLMNNCFIQTMSVYKNYITFALYFLLSYIIIFDNDNINLKHKNSDAEIKDNNNNIAVNIKSDSLSNQDTDDIHWGQFEDIEKHSF